MELVWKDIVLAIQFIFEHLIMFNLLFAIVIVFFQRRDPTSVWAWLLLLYFVPIIGFILYLLVGMDTHKQKIFKTKGIEDKLNKIIKQQEYHLKSKQLEAQDPEIRGYSDLVMYNLESTGAWLTDDNDVTIYTDGNEKFNALIEDLKQAQDFIHIQYYIIKNDVLFNRMKEVLVQKVKEGVEVRILYDGMGSRTVKQKYWRELKKTGIEIAEFFPAFLKRIHLRINYRNHRKIVVIDNRVGYVGGFNIGREYIGLDDKFGYWRDTHLRVEGSAVLGLELRFVLDWNYAAGKNLLQNQKYFEGIQPGYRDNCAIQIISSGPDSAEKSIRNTYVRLIHKAKKSIYIQTPYFIPDETMLTALQIALRSGVEVNIMIPCKPDHPFVYWATYSYIGELVMAGANCYRYDKGFLHAKGMIADEDVFCYGTANMDIRSFGLNFEVDAVVYDKKKVREMIELFEQDLENSTKITRELYVSRSLKIRFKEQISRLLSPLL